MTYRRILTISTTTHEPKLSTSVAMSAAAVAALRDRLPHAEVRAIDANKLHIVKNLSCYANGKRDCANPDAGPYRCWAHVESMKDPDKYGGADQMPVIYDALAWADLVLWSTSTRWGSHSALMQRIIERMDTLENRGASWGEPYPLRGKRVGTIVGGLHWKSLAVAAHLTEVWRWYGFPVPEQNGAYVWQRTADPYFEHPDNDRPYLERWQSTPEGRRALGLFVDALLAV